MTPRILLILVSFCPVAAVAEFDAGRAPISLSINNEVYLHREDVQCEPSVMVDARGFRKRWLNSSEAPPLPDGLQSKHRRQFP